MARVLPPDGDHPGVADLPGLGDEPDALAAHLSGRFDDPDTARLSPHLGDAVRESDLQTFYIQTRAMSW